MTPFGLSLPGSVAFGRGAADTALSELVLGGDRVLLVRGSSAFAGLAEIRLTEAGALAGVVRGSGEPDLATLDTALKATRSAGATRVLAIGGGSTIDLGKAIAALVGQEHGPMAYLEGVGEGRALSRPILPVTAMPTTAGTGAEVTRNAVISVPEHGRKVSLRDPRMVPQVAVVDPGLTDGCPRAVTLASGLDAVVQVIEPYLSCKANPWTDSLSQDAISLGIGALVTLMAEATPEARDAMAYTSLCGGLALANSGLGAVHGLAGVIGGRSGAAHGVICGRLLVPILRANAAAGANPDRMQDVRTALGIGLGVLPDESLDALERWIDAQGLERLHWPGADSVAQWVAEAQGASSMRGNPVALSDDVLIEAVHAASDVAVSRAM